MERLFHIIFYVTYRVPIHQEKRVSQFFNNLFLGIDIFIIFTLPNKIEIINLSML